MSSLEPASLADIDPQLTELDNAAAAATNVEDDAQQDFAVEQGESSALAHDVDTSDNKDVAGDSAGKKRKKKPSGTVPGSTADYKRKEANRLAAERSRSRQAEKRASLDEAARRLDEERAKLLDEIERLEHEASGGSGYTLQRHQHQERHESEQSPGLDQRVPIEHNNGEGSSTMTATEADAEAEAQAHSRTILAALMSDADINQALGSDWMHQDDQEAEVSQALASSTDTAVQASVAPAQEDSVNQSPRQSSATQHDEAGTSTPESARPGMAVSLHAEMERHLRDDLAATKIAIDRVEKELAVLRGAVEVDPGEVEQPAYISPLPANITSSDITALDTLTRSLQHEYRQVEERLPVVKNKVASLMNSRITEAERLKTLLLKLKVDEDDKAAVDKILRPLSTHLDGLLQSLAPERADALHAILGSTIAPAIAPRRRGRPPMFHPSTKHRVPVKRGPRAKNARSKLSTALSASATGTPDDTTPGLEQDETDAAGREIHPLPRSRPLTDPSTLQPSQQSQHQAHPVMDLEMDHISDMQAEMTTEELISQLANHDDQDLRDLLTSHAENEYATQQAIAAHLQQQLDSQANPLDTPTHGHARGVNQGESGSAGELVLASFKQGPSGSCDVCARTETTVWRKIRHHDEDLHVCNPCGMYHIKTGGRIRPPELWGDGKMIRTRRKSTHPRGPKNDAKRFKPAADADGLAGLESTGDQIEQHGDADGGPSQEAEVQMAVANLGEVDGHDEFRASLGMAGIGDIMRNFGEHVEDDVSQDVANVFGNVE